MSNVLVQKVSEEKSLPEVWLGEIEKFRDRVRCRAFGLFERQGRAHGHDLDHWLEAERQLFAIPSFDLLDRGNEFEQHIALPGFDPKEIEVTALPSALLVKAETSRKSEKKEHHVCYSEFTDQSLFRRISLPEPIDVSQVTAKLDKGVLCLVARKAAAQKDKVRRIHIAAA